MKPITEEQCQALISFNTKRLKSLKFAIKQSAFSECREDLELELVTVEIALASLTAEPIEYLTWHQGCRAPDDCEDYAVVATKGEKSCDGTDAFPVYTAPPVPVIKPDQLEGLQVSVDVSTCDADAGNRIFGRVSSVTESKGETALVVEEVERNFNPVEAIKFPDSFQDAFEEDNNIPEQTSRCGTGYCSHSFHNWKSQEFMSEFSGFIKGVKYVKRLNGIED